MLESFINLFRVPELKKRLIFTALLVMVYRLGAHIVVPGVDAKAVAEYFGSTYGGFLGVANLFTGGAFKRLSIFSLGIMPYISASIILQLLTAVIPALEKLSKEGEEGRKKINQYTRYGTVILSIIQAFGLSMWMQNMGRYQGSGIPVVPQPGIGFQLMTVLTLTAGTTFIMWLGEQITERGIGNGISLIIFIGIVAAVPQGVIEIVTAMRSESMTLFTLLMILIATFVVVALVVIVQQGKRKIPVSYAKQVRGRKMFGGQNTFLPLKVDYSGIIAVIFASSILMFPQTLAQFFSGGIADTFLGKVSAFLDKNSPYNIHALFLWIFPGFPDNPPLTIFKIFNFYNLLFAALVIFFCYFYTAIAFNPKDISENLKKFGGFIPGRRPGANTAEFIERVMIRLTLAGSIFVVFICVFPDILSELIGRIPSTVDYLLGGTSLLIVVGVALDTLSQLESHMVERHYSGFLKKGKLRARR